MGNSCPVRSGGMKIHTKRKFGIVPKGRNACVEEEGVRVRMRGRGKLPQSAETLQAIICGTAYVLTRSPPTPQRLQVRKWNGIGIRGLPSAWDKTQLDSILPGHMAAMAPRLYSPYSQPQLIGGLDVRLKPSRLGTR
jgi:hypothetical protein